VRTPDHDLVPEPVTTVAYPGPAGSHSDAATSVLAPEAARTIGMASFGAVIDAAASAEVNLGVLPIESSLAGPIAETHDLLYEAPLSIVREATLAIRHCVVGQPGAILTRVRTVRSHPAAFEQCRTLLSQLTAKRIPAATTADAAREVAELGDPTQVAIASVQAAVAYGLEVLANDVGDNPGAYTRFVAVAPYTRVDGKHEGWRTAISFVTDHQPGALYRALEPFARHDLNMVQLVSRPLLKSRWRYRFDVVFDGHPLDGEVKIALGELRSLTRALRLLGCYPAEGAE
jgi:prephenate dehydratase